jgi:hypothetical protein
MQLVELLYWQPIPTKGSKGESIYAATFSSRRRNPDRMSRPDPTRIVEMSSEEEGAEDSQIPSSSLTPSRRRKFEWPADMDLEARMAYGRAMMSGHGMLSIFANYWSCVCLDRDYDPALFEGAFEMGGL